jgi:hypothetical protein
MYAINFIATDGRLSDKFKMIPIWVKLSTIIFNGFVECSFQ